MKRYFDVTGKRLTLEIEVNEKGKALSVEQISKHFNMELREVSKKEYVKLCNEYE